MISSSCVWQLVKINRYLSHCFTCVLEVTLSICPWNIISKCPYMNESVELRALVPEEKSS